MTNVVERKIRSARENQSQRLLARMFFLRIGLNLHALDDWLIKPAETAVLESGFKTAIPQNRTRGVGRDGLFEFWHRLLPEKSGVTRTIVLQQSVGEGRDVQDLESAGESGGARPDGESDVKLAIVGEIENYVEIRFEISRNDVVENFADVGDDAVAAGESFGAALGVGLNSFFDLGKRSGNFILAQKEISVTPVDFSGQGSGAFGFDVGCAGVVEFAGVGIIRGESEKRFRRKRIERTRDEQSVKGGFGIGVFKIILVEAAEQKPIASVGGFETSCLFVTGASVEVNGVHGARVADAEVNEKCGRDEREKK